MCRPMMIENDEMLVTFETQDDTTVITIRKKDRGVVLRLIENDDPPFEPIIIQPPPMPKLVVCEDN